MTLKQTFPNVIISLKRLFQSFSGLISLKTYSWNTEAISDLFPLSLVLTFPSFLQPSARVFFLERISELCHSPASHLSIVPHWPEPWFPNCVLKVPWAWQLTHIITFSYFKYLRETKLSIHGTTSATAWGSLISTLDWLHFFWWHHILQKWVFSDCYDEKQVLHKKQCKAKKVAVYNLIPNLWRCGCPTKHVPLVSNVAT